MSTSIASFASEGYVITATTTNTAGYTLWGFKRPGGRVACMPRGVELAPGPKVRWVGKVWARVGGERLARVGDSDQK